MKVVLVSNWSQMDLATRDFGPFSYPFESRIQWWPSSKCGVAEYGRNLVEHLDGSGVEIQMLTPFELASGHQHHEEIYKVIAEASLVHINYSSYAYSAVDFEDWAWLKQKAKQILFTFHDSSLSMTKAVLEKEMFSKVVVHRKYPISNQNLLVIPQPIQMVYLPKQEVNKKAIAVVGMPFPWKSFEKVASVANKMGLDFIAMTSEGPQVDLGKATIDLLKLHPKAKIFPGWKKYRVVVEKLATCACSVFDYNVYQFNDYGVSAAVRMGIAAQRPVLVSNADQFIDLREQYPDEVYSIVNLEETLTKVLEDVEKGVEKVPKKIIEDMNWPRVASMYADLYREMAA